MTPNIQDLKIVSEIEIVRVKPRKGLIAYVTFVLFESLYCSSVALFSRRDGSGYFLSYPQKMVGEKKYNVYHPIGSWLGDIVIKEVSKKYEELVAPADDNGPVLIDSTTGERIYW